MSTDDKIKAGFLAAGALLFCTGLSLLVGPAWVLLALGALIFVGTIIIISD